ncbi:MAG: hypothetical protein GYB20_02600 [Oceanospirillales bacterium]|nr:hypothetical protein [Oceanospirillales bacterium]MBR9886581.1 hypothetical protein [Oceanospirillales bacterium]
MIGNAGAYPSIGDGAKVISGNEISNNEIGGSLLLQPTIVNLPSYDIGCGAEALKNLITHHEQLKEDSPQYLFVLEELQSKIRNVESREVVGLEAKLITANRLIYLDQARMSSQKASKMILRFQHVKSYQIIFTHILSLILTRFNSQILPMLRDGSDDIAISSAINSTIVEPLYQEVTLAGGFVTSELVEGMLYFLTEKCHVEWK